MDAYAKKLRSARFQATVAIASIVILAGIAVVWALKGADNYYGQQDLQDQEHYAAPTQQR